MTTNFSNLKLSYKPGPILLTSHACSLWRVVVVVSHARSQAPERVWWSDSSTSDNQHTTLCRRLSLAGSGTNLRSYWWRRAALSRLVVSLQSESFLSNPLTLPDGCSCSATTCHTQSWKDYKFTMRECISVHIGQAGAQIGNACWELYCLEHGKWLW